MPGLLQFRNRQEAGRELASMLDKYREAEPIVLGLARGGVPVAAEVARRLGAPLDVLVVRRLAAPSQPEYALGAIARGALRIDEIAARAQGVSRDELSEIVERESRELERRERLYRRGRMPLPVKDRTVLIVDDGLATGHSAEAAIESVRRRGPGEVIFAAPVCAQEGAARLRREADEVICGVLPPAFLAVSHWYGDFSETSDADVIRSLDDAMPRRVAAF